MTPDPDTTIRDIECRKDTEAERAQSATDLLADFIAYCKSEECRIGWHCGANDDDHFICHVGNVNALYNGSCSRCKDGIKCDHGDEALCAIPEPKEA